MSDATPVQRGISIEADAERYRWLRGIGRSPIVVRDESTGVRLAIAELDDAIDKERARSAFPRFIPSTTAVTRRTTLIRAAEILEREADMIFTAHSVDGEWFGGLCTDAKADHAEMLAIAGELRKEAE